VEVREEGTTSNRRETAIDILTGNRSQIRKFILLHVLPNAIFSKFGRRL
jgi:hypothetical protein